MIPPNDWCMSDGVSGLSLSDSYRINRFPDSINSPFYLLPHTPTPNQKHQIGKIIIHMNSIRSD
jgi:hypothetical protein